MAISYRLGIFGVPHLRDPDGRTILFRTQKHLALLVYLALEAKERAVPREVLAELFWPNVGKTRDRHSLSQGFSAIRERLGANALTRGGPQVRLLAPVRTDLDALASGEGLISDGTPPLEGMESVAGAAFAHWVDATRGHCIRAARRMLANELETARDQGRIDRVQEHATALYRVDPFSNPAAVAGPNIDNVADDSLSNEVIEHNKKSIEQLANLIGFYRETPA